MLPIKTCKTFYISITQPIGHPEEYQVYKAQGIIKPCTVLVSDERIP